MKLTVVPELPPEAEVETDEDIESLATQRGLTPRVLVEAGISRATEGNHEGWYTIPYPHRSGAWKTRYRNPDPEGRPKYLDDPGAVFHLYNPQLLGPGEEEVWFAEGEFDTLALVDQGLNVIGIHGVSNIAEPEPEDSGQTDRGFKKEWKLLFQDTLCVTMFDNDDAGRQAGRRLARGLDGEAFDAWNNDYGDINEWHKADPDGLADAIDGYRTRLHSSKGMG